jgi:hypothetical protein
VLSVFLMAEQRGFGDNATESNRHRQSAHCDDQMNEYDGEFAHPGNGIHSSKKIALSQFGDIYC